MFSEFRLRMLYRGVAASCLSVILASCAVLPPELAPAVAEPATPASRNFTSFTGALRCLDDMFKSHKKRPTLISSSDIIDDTKAIRVGADDMLINAINQTNRRSRAYQFLDQELIRDPGQLALITADEKQRDEWPMPSFYIRGSISQLDDKVSEDEVGLEGGWTPGRVFSAANFSRNQTLSVVSVDLHLVRYPSRRVVPGGSVANSMVVIRQGGSAWARGLIKATSFRPSLRIQRVESQSEAVRHLIELGVVELLGKHAGVPYWTCLGKPVTEVRERRREANTFTIRADDDNTRRAELLMIAGGLIPGPADAGLSGAEAAALARYQAKSHLIARGRVDLQTLRRLERDFSGVLDVDRSGGTSARTPNPKAVVRSGTRATGRTANTAPVRSTGPSQVVPPRDDALRPLRIPVRPSGG